VRDADFADLDDTRGRHARSPALLALLALVTVFQFLEGVPDRAAAEAVALRLDGTYALHLPVSENRQNRDARPPQDNLLQTLEGETASRAMAARARWPRRRIAWQEGGGHARRPPAT